MIELSKCTLRRHEAAPGRPWLVEWKTTGMVEYIGDHGSAKMLASELADELERLMGGETIASALARTRPASLDNPESTSEHEEAAAVGQWRTDIQAVSDALREGGDRDRFLDGCYAREG